MQRRICALESSRRWSTRLRRAHHLARCLTQGYHSTLHFRCPSAVRSAPDPSWTGVPGQRRPQLLVCIHKGYRGLAVSSAQSSGSDAQTNSGRGDYGEGALSCRRRARICPATASTCFSELCKSRSSRTSAVGWTRGNFCNNLSAHCCCSGSPVRSLVGTSERPALRLLDGGVSQPAASSAVLQSTHPRPHRFRRRQQKLQPPNPRVPTHWCCGSLRARGADSVKPATTATWVELLHANGFCSPEALQMADRRRCGRCTRDAR
jgi:hypothetical protein